MSSTLNRIPSETTQHGSSSNMTECDGNHVTSVDVCGSPKGGGNIIMNSLLRLHTQFHLSFLSLNIEFLDLIHHIEKHTIYLFLL